MDNKKCVLIICKDGTYRSILAVDILKRYVNDDILLISAGFSQDSERFKQHYMQKLDACFKYKVLGVIVLDKGILRDNWFFKIFEYTPILLLNIDEEDDEEVKQSISDILEFIHTFIRR